MLQFWKYHNYYFENRKADTVATKEIAWSACFSHSQEKEMYLISLLYSTTFSFVRFDLYGYQDSWRNENGWFLTTTL